MQRGDAQTIDENALDELLRAHVGQGRIERQHQDRVDACRRQQTQSFGNQREQPRRNPGGAEDCSGCEIEADGQRLGVFRARLIALRTSESSRWPRCTPSKLPMATTVCPRVAGISFIDRYTGIVCAGVSLIG